MQAVKKKLKKKSISIIIMQAEQEPTTREHEYVLHYEEGPGETGAICVKGDPFSTLFHFGQTKKVVKVERIEVEVKRVVMKAEDLSDQYREAMSMWEYRFTRILDPNNKVYHISDSEKANEIYQNMTTLYGTGKVKMGALVNIYIPKSGSGPFCRALEDLVVNEWGSTCQVFWLKDDQTINTGGLEPSRQCALSIVLLEKEEALKQVIETLRPRSRLIYVVLSSSESNIVYDFDLIWKMFETTWVQVSRCSGYDDEVMKNKNNKLRHLLNTYVSTNVNARYLAPKKGIA